MGKEVIKKANFFEKSPVHVCVCLSESICMNVSVCVQLSVWVMSMHSLPVVEFLDTRYNLAF